jgi:hypothetical protein
VALAWGVEEALHERALWGVPRALREWGVLFRFWRGKGGLGREPPLRCRREWPRSSESSERGRRGGRERRGGRGPLETLFLLSCDVGEVDAIPIWRHQMVRMGLEVGGSMAAEGARGMRPPHRRQAMAGRGAVRATGGFEGVKGVGGSSCQEPWPLAKTPAAGVGYWTAAAGQQRDRVEGGRAEGDKKGKAEGGAKGGRRGREGGRGEGSPSLGLDSGRWYVKKMLQAPARGVAEGVSDRGRLAWRVTGLVLQPPPPPPLLCTWRPQGGMAGVGVAGGE